MGVKEDVEAFRALVDSDETVRSMRPAPPSKAESAVRGVSQGFTSGWGDEIGAAIDTGVSKIPGVRNVAQMLHDDKLPRIDDPSVPYDQRRDAYRANNAAAAAENPVTYRGGEVGGGLLQMAAPGVRALNAAGPVARVVGNSALGGVGGAGFSEESGSRLAKDAIKGAGVGATVGALSAVAGGGGATSAAGRTAAEEAAAKGSAGRSDERVYQNIGRKAGAKAQQRLETMPPEYIADIARKHGLVNAPDPRVPARAAQQQIGSKIGDAYSAIDATGAVAPLSAATERLATIEAKLLKTHATQPMAAEIASLREHLTKTYPNGIPPGALNAEITGLQTQGFASASPTAAANLKRATAHALDEVLDASLAEAAKHPQAGAAVQALPELNREYSALKTINEVYKKRIPAERFAVPKAPTMMERATGPIKGAATAVDEGLATGIRAIPGGQKAARAVATGARALSPAIIDHLQRGDTKSAIDQMGAEVYGP